MGSSTGRQDCKKRCEHCEELSFRERNAFTGAYCICLTAEIAKAKAETEFEKYRVIQDRQFLSDFDKYMLELEENAKKK